jgi:hypothetical protein
VSVGYATDRLRASDAVYGAAFSSERARGSDDDALVYYVGFYDPAVTPCNNPLAVFEDQREA